MGSRWSCRRDRVEVEVTSRTPSGHRQSSVNAGRRPRLAWISCSASAAADRCPPTDRTRDGERPWRCPSSERARALIAWLALHPEPSPRRGRGAAVAGHPARERAGQPAHRASGRSGPRGARSDSPLEATRTTLALADTSVDVDDEPSSEEGFAELLPGLDDEWVRRRASRAGRPPGPRADRPRGAGRGRRRPARGRALVAPPRRAAASGRVRSPGTCGAAAPGRRARRGRRRGPGVRRTAARGGRRAPLPRDPGRARPRVGGDGQRAAPARCSAGRQQVSRLTERWREAADGRGQVVVLDGRGGHRQDHPAHRAGPRG